nr:immunoglobulin heavy chain junction region [Mus musculus]
CASSRITTVVEGYW